jgi:hypothetical protein
LSVIADGFTVLVRVVAVFIAVAQAIAHAVPAIVVVNAQEVIS